MNEANELWSSAVYRQLVAKIEDCRVIVPDYNYETTNIEEYKFRSAQKQMHDLVMKILKPKE